ncbi:MAG: general secretion pathway protein C [Bradymonadia bacterium]|jgi:general secretion pathway protein C
MEGLTKRYFWVVNLAVLAVLAFLAARVLNNIAAREIASLQTQRAVRAPVKASARATSASKREWAGTVNNRNLFNSTPPEPEEYADAGPKEDGETGDLSGMPRPWDPCKESESSIGLSATMVAEPAEWSFAVLDDGENDEERLMRTNQKIAEFTLAAIQRERVVLAKGGSFECVVLGEKKKKKRPTRSKRRSKKTSNSSKIKDGVKKTGKNQYQIDREMLNEQLEDLATLAKGARVIPHYRDGRPQGFKIVGVRPGSLYSHIGVRSGDVLKGVNGEEITSPNKALALYEQLKNSENVNVEIERRGRKVGLEYNIK